MKLVRPVSSKSLEAPNSNVIYTLFSAEIFTLAAKLHVLARTLPEVGVQAQLGIKYVNVFSSQQLGKSELRHDAHGHIKVGRMTFQLRKLGLSEEHVNAAWDLDQTRRAVCNHFVIFFPP